jgi:DnaK suppressor protein
MNTTSHPNLEQIQVGLREQRTLLMRRVRDHLHRSEDPVVLALVYSLPDSDDAPLLDLLADMDLAVLGREIAELNDIDDALARIAAGTYGLCAECGDKIDVERLTVQPAARLCLDCRAAFEKRRGIVRTATI